MDKPHSYVKKHPKSKQKHTESASFPKKAHFTPQKHVSRSSKNTQSLQVKL